MGGRFQDNYFHGVLLRFQGIIWKSMVMQVHLGFWGFVGDFSLGGCEGEKYQN
jgi:hypothetical protein